MPIPSIDNLNYGYGLIFLATKNAWVLTSDQVHGIDNLSYKNDLLNDKFGLCFKSTNAAYLNVDKIFKVHVFVFRRLRIWYLNLLCWALTAATQKRTAKRTVKCSAITVAKVNSQVEYNQQ